ncbi:MAG: VWA domain-containing protein [Edaphobacter sp.]
MKAIKRRLKNWRFECTAAIFLIGAATGQQVRGQPPPEVSPTLKVSVKRVAVDVVVTDTTGKPVKGLTAAAFRVFEDGKPQAIRAFTSYRIGPQPKLDLPKLPANTFSNFVSGPQSEPVTVILYDLLNTPLDAQSFAREQLLSYLKSRNATTPIAIFVLSDRVHLLQGFTDDDKLLIMALNQKHRLAYKSSMLPTGDEATQQSDQLAQTEGNPNAARNSLDPSYKAVSTMLKHMEAVESSALLDRRVDITSEALTEISSFLQGVPGRKNLLWLSGSFPAGVLPDPNLGGRDSFDVTRSYSATIQATTNSLNQNHIAIYPVDVRGLHTNPMFGASNNINFSPGSGEDMRAMWKFADSLGAEYATMDTIADQTGGHASYNTNGLKDAIVTALDDGSAYYAMTYSPADTQDDGTLRHIKVECLKPGYHLSYRQTYFADNSKAPIVPLDESKNDPMNLALRYGAPPEHELFFEVHVQTEGAPVVATSQKMNVLTRYRMNGGKKNIHMTMSKTPTMMQHYLVSYALLGRQLELTSEADGMRHGDLEFAVMVFDDDGNTIDGIRTKVQDVINPKRYEQIWSGAYQLLQRIEIPLTAASMRIGVRDRGTGHIGSMELRLPLAPAR